MKKIIVVIFFLLIALGIFAQSTDIETVMEIQAERELANWIESMLYPIVGDNVAIVDMTLRYPSEGLKVYGSTLDTERSLPGLPVARSSGVMPSEIAGEETYPTIVVKKVVTIYLSKTTTEAMESFVHQNVTSWVNIVAEKGDKLEVKRVLDLKADEDAQAEGDTIIQTQDYRNYIIIIGAVMLFLLVIFLLIFSTRMTKLSKALKEVNIPGLESVLRPSGVTQTMTRQKEQKSDKPVTVKLLPQSDKKEEDLSFKFIEDLSPQSCGKLLSNESPESAAFILSQLSAAYVSNFFNNFPGNTDLLLRSMVNGKQLAKTEITKMHHRLQKNYNELMEKESLEYDNQNLVASLINNLPAKTSESIFKKITQIDSSFANLMRKDIFLLEDLVNLEANQIEDIIRYVNRDLLINYLYNAAPEVRSKFLNNMTQRNRQIFEEELQNVTPFDDEQIAMINDELLEQIRRLFALV